MASNIDPTKPEDGIPASKAALRNNLQAAKEEILALQDAVSAGHTGSAAIFPEDYGANPNGSFTGNAAAINAAIFDASDYTVAGQRRGGRVQLSRGTYLINEPILLRSLTELQGVGQASSTIEVVSGANCRAIQTVNDNQILYGIRDLGIFGNASGQAADDGTPGGDRGGVYMINAKAEPSGIGDFRFLGGCRSWAQNLLIQEVAGNGLYVQGNSGWMVHNIQVRWTKRYGFYIDSNDGSFDQLIASRTGWAGLFFDGASSRLTNLKLWFCGVEMHRWKEAKDWAQANNTTLYNRQFDDNQKAGCGILIRGDNSTFSVVDVQDTAGHGMYIQSRRSLVDCFNADQCAQVNAGGSTTRYSGGGAGAAFDWISLNPGKPIVGVFIRQNTRGYVRAHVYDINYNLDGTPGGSVLHDVLGHLVWNDETQMELAATGASEIPQRLTGVPVRSKTRYRLHGEDLAANA